ncbi:MAG: flagellar assembly protein FliW [Candidatus Omnitrophica bacterium]|nr:flagellar assembly protein FliW [Candidatus Omnitrophota bacterium]
MKITTTRFGEIEVTDEKVLYFPEGIIGFHSIKRFVLLGKESRLVMWLQAVDNPKVAFIVVNPFLFETDYDPKLTQEEYDFLKVKDSNDLHILAIVVVPEDPEKMTANLLGPIVINTKEKLGKQVILLEGNYSVKHSIVKAAVHAEPISKMVS